MKTAINDFVGISRDALHVLSGVGLQLFFVLVLRSWMGGIWPWLLVLLATVANEWFDLAYEIWPSREEQWGETRKDLISTMILPSLLLLLSRFGPGIFQRRRQAPPADAGEPAGESGSGG